MNINNSFQTAATDELSRTMSAWLDAPDPSTNLATARNKRQQATGTWLLNSPRFLKWKSEASSFLWLHGKAGSGKTILSSTAVHSLFEQRGKDTTVVYFYFDFQIHEKQLLQSLLKSLADQLFTHNHQTFKILEDSYNLHSCGRTIPSLQDLKAVIRRLIDKSAAVYLFIDALDECADREDLIETLEEITRWKQTNVHIFVTSRRETYIEDSLNVIATDEISLEESVVDEDIRSYIQYQLQHEKRLAKWSDDIRMEIETALVKGANGMFRWVECQLNAIKGCLKVGLLRKTLNSLPKTLDDTYTRILDNIPEDYVEDVCRILSCLICSFHPLAVEEIADTVAIVADGEAFYNPENRLAEPRDVLSICSGLVTTAESTRMTWLGFQHLPIEELRLAHFSVKEFLVSERKKSTKASAFVLNERQAHETLAKLCVRYLQRCHHENLCEDPNFLWRYATLRSEKVPFAPYAATSWSRHLRAAQLNSSAPLIGQCLQMLTNSALLRDIIRLHTPWFRLKELRITERCGYVKPIKGKNSLITTVKPVPPLYYASLLGMDQLVIMLLEKGDDVNCYCPHGTCLAAAVTGSHSSTVQLLVERGAEVNARILQTDEEEISYSKTAVHEAVLGAFHSQREDIITMLLANGADVNVGRAYPGRDLTSMEHNTPLQAAVQSSHKRLVQLMIDAGADPNAWAGGYSTALEIAAGDKIRPDSLDIMIMLLDAGADANMTSDPIGIKTPLWMAIQAGNLPGVRLLLERGADWASIEGRIIPHFLRHSFRWETRFKATVQTLVQLAPLIAIELPLVAAAKYGFAKSIDYILRHGAAPDSQEQDGTSALQAAAFAPASDTETVELLLDAGAEVNARQGPFGSALQAAALSGKAGVVRLLLEKGASVDYADGDYGTALQIARKRLDDQDALCPGTWKHGDRIERYGPSHYYSGDRYPLDADELSIRGPSKTGDYEAKINILHRSNADYRAVIELLLSHGAKDI